MLPKLSEEDIRTLLLGLWVIVCVAFLGLHLDIERANTLQNRTKVQKEILSNQKQIAAKLGIPLREN